MIHVAALPRTPRSRQQIADIAEKCAIEAGAYAAAGFHGLTFENAHVRPYLKDQSGLEIAAAMAMLGSEVRRAA